MLRILPPIFMAVALLAQTPPVASPKAPPETSPAPPPEVDAALRARISRFYQLEVEGKFSQALPLVADDTKDMFIGTSKPTYRAFEIGSIRYSSDFTKAEVMTMVNRLMPIEGFLGHPLNMKQFSRWKLENGQWCFYVDPEKDLPASPFGGALISQGMPPAGMPPAGTPPVPSVSPGGKPLPPPVPVPSHLAVVIADKPGVQLKSSGPSSDQVVMVNKGYWPLTLTLTVPKVTGLTAKLDRATVNPGEKAIVTIQSSGAADSPKQPCTIQVTVPKTNQVIPIKVSFAP